MSRRNNYSLDFKRAVVRELKESGKQVKQVADKYNLNANTLCQWRTRMPAPKRRKVNGASVAVSPPSPAEHKGLPVFESATDRLAELRAEAKIRSLQDANHEGAARRVKAEARVEVLEATLKVWQEAYADLLQHVRRLTSVSLPPPPDADPAP